MPVLDYRLSVIAQWRFSILGILSIQTKLRGAT
jgi:hypothetical protein